MSRLAADLQLALDPARLMRGWGMLPEPWQEQVLRSRPQRALLCCCRQAGKSSTAAAAAVHEALYHPASLTLMLAPSQRQSNELLRKTHTFVTLLQPSVRPTAESQHSLELANGSRIISLPAREDTIRGFSHVALLVFDEAAWVEDELYLAARPMLAVSDGRLLALSTPNGQRGWFYNAWVGTEHWQRTRLTAAECPRITPDFLAEERRTMTAARFASEYDCEFTDAIDSVFRHADIVAALDEGLLPLFPTDW
jgi:hypothetical protein